MSRIYQYPVVTEIGSDDYLALGSAANGSRAILASDLAPVIGNKTITERGTYKASDDNMDGYGQVTVDIPYTDIHVASGDIATFEGEDLPLKSLKVAVTPYQDLHGYDAPWGRGAGSNKYPIEIGDDVWVNNASGTTHSDNDGELIINTTTSTYSGVYGGGQQKALVNQQSVAKTVSFDIKGSVSATIAVQNVNVDITTSYQRKYITVPANTSASLSIYGNGTANTIYIKNLAITEDGSTDYTPYSNICPIIGWDECKVTRCGDNILDESNLTSGYIDTDGTITNNASYSATGYLDFSNVNSIKYGVTKEDTGGWYYRIGCYNASKTFLGFAVNRTLSSGVYEGDADLLNNTNYIIVCWVNSSSNRYIYDKATYNTYTIDLDGTRYGGVVDATNGTMTVDRAYVDLGTLTWNRTTSYSMPMFYATIAGKLISNISMLCSVYKFSGDFSGAASFAQSSENGSIGNCYNNEQIFVRDDAYTDATTFKTAMSGVQLVYELATPITFQLAPTPVKSIEGENNIFANCGAVDVEYQTVWVRPTN